MGLNQLVTERIIFYVLKCIMKCFEVRDALVARTWRLNVIIAIIGSNIIFAIITLHKEVFESLYIENVLKLDNHNEQHFPHDDILNIKYYFE